MEPTWCVRLARVGFGLVLAVLGGCLVGRPPVRTVPLAEPEAGSALVIFFRQDSDRGPFSSLDLASVLDEEGQLLGRLSPQSWFAVARPPGPQSFVAPGSGNCLTGGSTSTGALRADLRPGRVYVVRLARFTLPFSVDRHMNFRCCYDSSEEPGLPRILHRELVAVRPGGTEWVRAAETISRGEAFEAAPQGLEPFGGGGRLVEDGLARFEGGCIDRQRSILESHHGSDSLPIVDP
ncbi:MAG: hypothetical protein AAGF12_38325 [Myxococcota bacterium]